MVNGFCHINVGREAWEDNVTKNDTISTLSINLFTERGNRNTNHLRLNKSFISSICNYSLQNTYTIQLRVA